MPTDPNAMTISKLIETLMSLRDMHGDLEVIIEYNGDEGASIDPPTPKVMSNIHDTVVVLNA